jgi:haloalkane dehalogenase
MTSGEVSQLSVVDIPGENPPFVLMHGFPDDHHIYDRLVSFLAPRRVVAFDFFGYGRSARGNDGAAAVVTPHEDLANVIDALLPGRVVLVGHDASGPIAVDYALEHPERIAHVVLVDALYGHARQLRLPEMIRLLADPGLAPLADAMVADQGQLLWLLQQAGRQFFGTDELPPDGIAVTSIFPQFFGSTDQPDSLSAIRAWTARLFDDLDTQDERIASGRLAALDVPVTLIVGADDDYLGEALAHDLAAHFRRAHVEVIADASHWPQWDQPDAVAGHLLALATGT